MSDSVLIALVLGAAIILVVLAYNIYQESKYRKQLRDQFGHANKDALLDSNVNSVRDNAAAKTAPSAAEQPVTEIPPADAESVAAESSQSTHIQTETDNVVSENQKTSVNSPQETPPQNQSILQTQTDTDQQRDFFSPTNPQKLSRTIPVKGRKTLLDVRDMSKQTLPWFDACLLYTF